MQPNKPFRRACLLACVVIDMALAAIVASYIVNIVQNIQWLSLFYGNPLSFGYFLLDWVPVLVTLVQMAALCAAHVGFMRMRKNGAPFVPGVSKTVKTTALLLVISVAVLYVRVAVLMLMLQGFSVLLFPASWLSLLALAAAVYAVGCALEKPVMRLPVTPLPVPENAGEAPPAQSSGARRGGLIATVIIKIALIGTAAMILWIMVLTVRSPDPTNFAWGALQLPASGGWDTVRFILSVAAMALPLAILCLAHAVFSPLRKNGTLVVPRGFVTRGFVTRGPRLMRILALLLAVGGVLPYLSDVALVLMGVHGVPFFSMGAIAYFVSAAAVWALSVGFGGQAETVPPQEPSAATSAVAPAVMPAVAPAAELKEQPPTIGEQ
ncbi:MAG: hypothetical protein FWF49_03325 [Oscillospiraceae bacterium]|nr:hypothetical protein [Oscillospiraceae bacterium]